MTHILGAKTTTKAYVRSPLNPGDRGGSHNLVIGGGNRFTQIAFGGFVAGERNTINGFGASVGGGYLNRASGLFATVCGGGGNTSGGFMTVVIGGYGVTDNKDSSIAPQPPFP